MVKHDRTWTTPEHLASVGQRLRPDVNALRGDAPRQRRQGSGQELEQRGLSAAVAPPYPRQSAGKIVRPMREHVTLRVAEAQARDVQQGRLGVLYVFHHRATTSEAKAICITTTTNHQLTRAAASSFSGEAEFRAAVAFNARFPPSMTAA